MGDYITANSLSLHGKIVCFLQVCRQLVLRKQRGMLSNVPLHAQLAASSSSLAQRLAQLDVRAAQKMVWQHQPHFVHLLNLYGQILQGCNSKNWICKHHCSLDFVLKGELNSQRFFACCQSDFQWGEGGGCAAAKYHLSLPPRHTPSPPCVTPFWQFDQACSMLQLNLHNYWVVYIWSSLCQNVVLSGSQIPNILCFVGSISSRVSLLPFEVVKSQISGALLGWV